MEKHDKHLWADIYEIVIDADQTDEIIELVNGHIKEFTEKLKKRLQEEDKISERLGLENDCKDLGVYKAIDELLKEFWE